MSLVASATATGDMSAAGPIPVAVAIVPTAETAKAIAAVAADREKDCRWYLSHDQLINSPSRRDGIPADQELSQRQKAAHLIQDMGQRLRVSQLCINTAIVYMHRFYTCHSFQIFHRTGIASASLFLSAKVEEQPRKVESIIHTLFAAQGLRLPEVGSTAYQEQSQDLVFNENVLLQTLGFNVAVEHPHTHVVKTCQLVKACKDLSQTSYFLASNSLHLSTMCLQYRPTVVACFCIYLACKWSRWEIPQSTEGRHWFNYVDPTVTKELLEQLTNDFLIIYDSSPSRLKKHLHSKGLVLNANSPAGIAGSPMYRPPAANTTQPLQQQRQPQSSQPRSTVHHHGGMLPPQMNGMLGQHTSGRTLPAVPTTAHPLAFRQPDQPHFTAPHRTLCAPSSNILPPHPTPQQLQAYGMHPGSHRAHQQHSHQQQQPQQQPPQYQQNHQQQQQPQPHGMLPTGGSSKQHQLALLPNPTGHMSQSQQFMPQKAQRKDQTRPVASADASQQQLQQQKPQRHSQFAAADQHPGSAAYNMYKPPSQATSNSSNYSSYNQSSVPHYDGQHNQNNVQPTHFPNQPSVQPSTSVSTSNAAYRHPGAISVGTENAKQLPLNPVAPSLTNAYGQSRPDQHQQQPHQQPSNQQHSVQPHAMSKRAHPDQMFTSSSSAQRDESNDNQAKYRKLNADHPMDATGTTNAYGGITMSTTAGSFTKPNNSFNSGTGIETDSDLVSSLLKESLCSNDISKYATNHLLGETNDMVFDASMLSLDSLLDAKPPLNLLASDAQETQPPYMQTAAFGGPFAQEPQQQQQQQANSSNPSAAAGVATSDSSDHEHKYKSDKKRRKDKSKHKERGKEREDRKKHKKERERVRDEPNDGGGNHHHQLGNSMLPDNDSLRMMLPTGVKITIPKDRLNGNENAANSFSRQQPLKLDELLDGYVSNSGVGGGYDASDMQHGNGGGGNSSSGHGSGSSSSSSRGSGGNGSCSGGASRHLNPGSNAAVLPPNAYMYS